MSVGEYLGRMEAQAIRVDLWQFDPARADSTHPERILDHDQQRNWAHDQHRDQISDQIEHHDQVRD